MNDYRNFQRKSSRKKGCNYNKHCHGKHCIQQKNKYSNIYSTKYEKQLQLQQNQRNLQLLKKTDSTPKCSIDLINDHDQIAEIEMKRQSYRRQYCDQLREKPLSIQQKLINESIQELSLINQSNQLNKCMYTVTIHIFHFFIK